MSLLTINIRRANLGKLASELLAPLKNPKICTFGQMEEGARQSKLSLTPCSTLPLPPMMPLADATRSLFHLTGNEFIQGPHLAPPSQ